MNVLAKKSQAIPSKSTENGRMSQQLLRLDAPFFPTAAPDPFAALRIAELKDNEAEAQALARKVSRVAGEAGGIAIVAQKTLAIQFEGQIKNVFEEARTGGDDAVLHVYYANLEDSEAVM